MQEPAWATEIIRQMCTEYERPIPAVNWRQSRKKPYTSGRTWNKQRIAITLGTKGDDHVETLLHELAHYVNKERGHGRDFYQIFLTLRVKYK
jgi:hypothetical protein